MIRIRSHVAQATEHLSEMSHGLTASQVVWYLDGPCSSLGLEALS